MKPRDVEWTSEWIKCRRPGCNRWWQFDPVLRVGAEKERNDHELTCNYPSSAPPSLS